MEVPPQTMPEVRQIAIYNTVLACCQGALNRYEVWLGTYLGDVSSAAAVKCGEQPQYCGGWLQREAGVH